MADKPSDRKLTLKMRTFALAFVGEAKGNGTEAARIAGYKGSESTLGVTAFDNLRNPKIVAFIEELRADAEQKLEKHIASASEILAELSEIALAEWREFVDIKYGEDGEVVYANLRLADKIKACELLGKHHGTFPTKIEITSGDADKLIDGAAKTHGLPVPETFGGEPLAKKEM